jgi:hypothetical protein
VKASILPWTAVEVKHGSGLPRRTAYLVRSADVNTDDAVGSPSRQTEQMRGITIDRVQERNDVQTIDLEQTHRLHQQDLSLMKGASTSPHSADRKEDANDQGNQDKARITTFDVEKRI